LLVFGLCISLIPISIITTIYYLNARNTLKKQILQDFKAIAESKRLHLMTFVESIKSRTIDFSSDGFIRDSLEAIAQGAEQSYSVIKLNKHLVNNKMPLDPHIVAIDVVGINGRVVSSTVEESIGRELSDNERFPQLVNGAYGDAYVKEPHRSHVLEDVGMDISAPMFAKSGDKFIGSIRLHYDTSAFNSITNDRYGMGETGEAYIVNRDKIMLTGSRFVEDAVLNQVVDTEPVRRIIDDGSGGMTGIYPDYRGVPVVGVSVDMPGYGWILLVEVDKREVFAPLRRLGTVALIVGSVCGAAAIGIGIIFSSSTARPINKLKYAAERIASGDLKYRVDIDRNDEIGALSSSFNIMTDELMEKDMAIVAEIDERKRAEEQITASLKEKEVLLREVHHRVKNNLQIISSLLDMSSMQTDNQETINLFTDSRNRINAMALIHSQLYRSERFDQINMEKHIQELSRDLLQIYAMEKVIALDVKSANVYLNINQAIPCALVLSELITNVCKHAYREGQKGTISISMQKSDDNTVLLSVKDDGAGIPEDIDIERSNSLGLSIVRNLVNNQLKGKIDFRMNEGTEVHIDFKVSEREVEA
jgi:two-component sensor histidine kinase/HAMP domain-containing protein